MRPSPTKRGEPSPSTLTGRVRARPVMRAAIIRLPLEVVDRAEHLVGGLDCLRVDLIGSLGHDHLHHVLDDLDVRAFEESGFELACARRSWVAHLWIAACTACGVEVLAHAVEARRG